MIQRLAAAVAATLILAAGTVHGLWEGRWGTVAGLKGPVERLARIPRNIGADWEAGKDRTLDERELAVGEIAGYVSRTYKNRRTDEVVSVLVVCGRPGPIAVHTPEICYAGAGYEMAERPARKEVAYGPDGKSTAVLQAAIFRKPRSVVPADLDIRWTWGAAGAWDAPSEPRLAFARHSALYKVYLVRDALGPGGDADPGGAFLADFFPALDAVLFGRD